MEHSHKSSFVECIMCICFARWKYHLGVRGLSWACRVRTLSLCSLVMTRHRFSGVPSKTAFYVFQEPEFLCLEFDEVKVNQILKKLSEVEESISTLMQPA